MSELCDEVEVRLTWREVHMAGVVAVSRTVDNLSRGLHDKRGLAYEDMGDGFHWLGAIGELAVAKYRNRYWDPLVRGAIDVDDVEVRAVGHRSRRLILHDDDDDGMPFILAVVDRSRLPLVTLRGWIMGSDGKQARWWQDPTGGNRYAFFVPHAQLLAMGALQ